MVIRLTLVDATSDFGRPLVNMTHRPSATLRPSGVLQSATTSFTRGGMRNLALERERLENEVESLKHVVQGLRRVISIVTGSMAATLEIEAMARNSPRGIEDSVEEVRVHFSSGPCRQRCLSDLHLGTRAQQYAAHPMLMEQAVQSIASGAVTVFNIMAVDFHKQLK